MYLMALSHYPLMDSELKGAQARGACCLEEPQRKTSKDLYITVPRAGRKLIALLKEDCAHDHLQHCTHLHLYRTHWSSRYGLLANVVPTVTADYDACARGRLLRCAIVCALRASR